MISTFDYSNRYSPSMPMVDMTIKAVKEQDGIELRTLVDSGADSTMIPLRHLIEVGADKTGNNSIRGVAGGRLYIELYFVYLQIGRQTFPVEVVGHPESDETILGRDILNRMTVTLDGLGSTVIIREDD